MYGNCCEPPPACLHWWRPLEFSKPPPEEAAPVEVMPPAPVSEEPRRSSRPSTPLTQQPFRQQMDSMARKLGADPKVLRKPAAARRKRSPDQEQQAVHNQPARAPVHSQPPPFNPEDWNKLLSLLTGEEPSGGWDQLYAMLPPHVAKAMRMTQSVFESADAVTEPPVGQPAPTAEAADLPAEVPQGQEPNWGALLADQMGLIEQPPPVPQEPPLSTREAELLKSQMELHELIRAQQDELESVRRVNRQLQDERNRNSQQEAGIRQSKGEQDSPQTPNVKGERDMMVENTPAPNPQGQEPDWQQKLAAEFAKAAASNQDSSTLYLIQSLQSRLDKAEKISAEQAAELKKRKEEGTWHKVTDGLGVQMVRAGIIAIEVMVLVGVGYLVKRGIEHFFFPADV